MEKTVGLLAIITAQLAGVISDMKDQLAHEADAGQAARAACAEWQKKFDALVIAQRQTETDYAAYRESTGEAMDKQMSEINRLSQQNAELSAQLLDALDIVMWVANEPQTPSAVYNDANEVLQRLGYE